MGLYEFEELSRPESGEKSANYQIRRGAPAGRLAYGWAPHKPQHSLFYSVFTVTSKMWQRGRAGKPAKTSTDFMGGVVRTNLRRSYCNDSVLLSRRGKGLWTDCRVTLSFSAQRGLQGHQASG